MLKFYLFLFALIVGIFQLKCCWVSSALNKSDPIFANTQCREHCRRLLERSLDRIGYSSQEVGKEYRLSRLLMSTTSENKPQRFANSKYYKDICWKYFDFEDCNRKCEMRFSTLEFKHWREKSVDEKNFLKSTKILIKSCTADMDNKLLAHFRCIHKYHTFLEVQCSSYAQEALVLRKIAREDKQKTKNIPVQNNGKNIRDSEVSKKSSDRYQETCRFLHYHGMCLSNSIFQYCPTAKDLFNRFTLREIFLSFVLPMEEDYLFSDPFLDHCQLYDFAKMAKDIYDSTKRPTTKRSLIDLIFSTPSTTVKPRKVFSSDEDLEYTPPNFYYSSAKLEKDFITYSTTKRYKNWDPSFNGLVDDGTKQSSSVSLLQPSTAASKMSTSSPTHQQQTIAVTFPDQLPNKPLPTPDNIYKTTYELYRTKENEQISLFKNIEEEVYSSKYLIRTTNADAHPETSTIYPSDEKRQNSDSVVIDVFRGNPDYYTSGENMDDYVIDSSTRSYSTEMTSQEQDTTSDSSSDLSPIVFPIKGEKLSVIETTKYSVTPANKSNLDNKSKEKPNFWVTPTQSDGLPEKFSSTQQDKQLIVPTPLLADSGIKIHVKKIVPFGESDDEQDNKKINKQDVTYEDRFREIDSQIEAEDYNTEDEQEDYTQPYTIFTAHPDDFITGKNVVEGDSTEAYLKNDPKDGTEPEVEYIPIQPVKPYYTNTLFVLFAIYSFFFIIAVAGLACLIAAYVIRNRRDRLKSSWIFFDDQERF